MTLLYFTHTESFISHFTFSSVWGSIGTNLHFIGNTHTLTLYGGCGSKIMNDTTLFLNWHLNYSKNKITTVIYFFDSCTYIKFVKLKNWVLKEMFSNSFSTNDRVEKWTVKADMRLSIFLTILYAFQQGTKNCQMYNRIM